MTPYTIRVDMSHVPTRTAAALHHRLRVVMMEAGLNQSQMAAAASSSGAPCSEHTMARYLKDGKRGMKAEHGFNLAKATGFDAEWLLLGRGEPLGRDGDLQNPHARMVRRLRVVIAELIQLATETK